MNSDYPFHSENHNHSSFSDASIGFSPKKARLKVKDLRCKNLFLNFFNAKGIRTNFSGPFATHTQTEGGRERDQDREDVKKKNPISTVTS